MDTRHDTYLAYLQSDRWALQRVAALARAKYRCSTCGSGLDLEVHHLTYQRLGDELPQDLAVLCGRCHERLHQQRDQNRRYARRLNGWATKVYGDDWMQIHSYDRVADDFETWLEQRDD